MKLVEAVIRPTKIDAVKEALTAIGVKGMTVTDVRGYGRQRGRTEKYRGSTYIVNLLPKIKIEFVIPDNLVEEATEAVIEAGGTGEIGDGKVFISHIEEAIRISSGERGDAAL